MTCNTARKRGPSAARPIKSITITLDLPHSVLNPNCKPATRGSRMKQKRLTESYRQSACLLAMQYRNDSWPWNQVLGKDVFYWPNDLDRDIRNAEGALKAAYDGIVDAGIIEDDNSKILRHEPSEFEIDRGHPRVEITITRKEQADE